MNTYFDLSCSGFQQHLKDFGYLHVAGERDSPRWEFTADVSRGKQAFMGNPYFQGAMFYQGRRYQYTVGEMETHWRIMCRAREILAREWSRYQEMTT